MLKFNDEPVINFVDHLLQEAIQKNISDIHIEPYEQHCRIRFRQNGLLHEVTKIPIHLAERIIVRLKILANLNIAESRLPQDGCIAYQSSQIDIRINTCPISFGEKIVLRLMHTKKNLEIDSLGMTTEQKELFLSALDQPQGLILVTGPTGSGKTMTLYSALNYLNKIEKNISSVEDPIEINFPGINQVHVNDKIGLHFSTILRTLLRQDPDIIMIGEIRDHDTAKIAIQAALTGHLVLSTLHTNHALESFARLKSMGITHDYFSHAVSLMIGQRLIRTLCPRCKTENDLTQYFVPVGCDVCHQGYSGRTGIFELLPMTSDLIKSISNQLSIEQIIQKIKLKKNITFLKDSALTKAKNGITSLTEIVRVIGDIKCEN
ncbi:MAG: hypothetical protein A3F12_02720 [Gammaproteobacteria bacterium RIFCSPHIGHO2_12_FULL_38_14]|nr:MAG: hypothetical protein A3F12_02720 [Gammaproteobacteria bacterium RIFCSPHIGHO2_12_FULL_38_14]